MGSSVYGVHVPLSNFVSTRLREVQTVPFGAMAIEYTTGVVGVPCSGSVSGLAPGTSPAYHAPSLKRAIPPFVGPIQIALPLSTAIDVTSSLVPPKSLWV